MKKTWIVAAVFACAAAVPHAQDQTRTPTGTPATPSQGGNQTVKVTGCVTEDPSATSSVAAQTARNENSNSMLGAFVLTNARMSNDSPTGTAEPSKESPSAQAQAPQGGATTLRPTGSHYILKGTETADLKPHVGHRVEITGRVDTRPVDLAIDASTHTVTGPPVGTSGANNPSSISLSAAPAETLVVESVRMIAEKCTP